jgi:hypothetical protein
MFTKTALSLSIELYEPANLSASEQHTGYAIGARNIPWTIFSNCPEIIGNDFFKSKGAEGS